MLSVQNSGLSLPTIQKKRNDYLRLLGWAQATHYCLDHDQPMLVQPWQNNTGGGQRCLMHSTPSVCNSLHANCTKLCKACRLSKWSSRKTPPKATMLLNQSVCKHLLPNQQAQSSLHVENSITSYIRMCMPFTWAVRFVTKPSDRWSAQTTPLRKVRGC